LCVKPAHALGALERGRLGCAGTGGVGKPGVAHVTCHMTQSHTRTPKASWEENKDETMALPPPKPKERGAFSLVFGLRELAAGLGYTTKRLVGSSVAH